MLGAAVVIPWWRKSVLHVVWCFCYCCNVGSVAVLDFSFLIFVAADGIFFCLLAIAWALGICFLFAD
jgi:hypothetical protein